MSNHIIIISGPSGCGKTSLIYQLLAEFTDACFCISHTTRERRENEQDGRDYFFIDQPEFRRMIDRGKFVEWAEIYRNYYGTSRQEVEEKSTNGKNLILDIDVQGAGNIKAQFPEALSIFIIPPSLEELRTRLQKRQPGQDTQVETRLKAALQELSHYAMYDYILVNDNLEQAYNVLRSIYIAFNHSKLKNKHQALIKQMIGRNE